MNRYKKIQRIADRWLSKSNHPDYVLASFLIKSNNIISVGINRKSPCPHYIRKTEEQSEISLHAEIDCLHMIDKNLTKKSVLLVCGKTKAGNYIKTKPCQSCENHIKKMGIKKVIYQEVDGSLKELRI